VPVRRIRLTGTGGSCERHDELRTPAAQLAVAAAGPVASGLAALLAYLLASLWAGPGDPVHYAALLVALSNGLLAVTSLLPIYPLDGGKLLFSLLWQRSGDVAAARRRAGRLGRVAASAVLLAGPALCALGTGLAVGSVVSAAGACLLRAAAS
jgi:Zn-dependent protease